jgi:hypothetical protein
MPEPTSQTQQERKATESAARAFAEQAAQENQ